MGGHGHHHEPYKVPDASTYKIEGIPELMEVEKALARQGLKDPWLRNEAWRYDPKLWGTHGQRARQFFLRGFIYGFAAFVVTIGAEFALSKGGGGGHGHGHGHEEGHGHGGH